MQRRYEATPEQAVDYARRGAKNTGWFEDLFYIYLDNTGWFVSMKRIATSDVVVYGYVQGDTETFIEIK